MAVKTAIVLCLATCAAAKLSQAQVSKLEKLKAGDVSKKEVELVLAHFNENQSWSDPYAAIRTTYCKGSPVPGCVPLENVGREGHTYLHHIVTNYDNLAEWTVFSQAGAPSVGYNGHRLGGGHMQPGVEFNDYLLRDGDSDSFFVFTGAMHLPTLFHAIRSSYMFETPATDLEETRARCPNTQSKSDGWERLDLPEWFQSMMAAKCGFQEGGLQQKLQQYWQDRVKTKMPEDGMVFFSQGARFAVSRDRIHQRPREEYMDLLAEVSGARDPCVNYMNEWLWYYIMGRPQAAPCDTPDIKMEAPASMASRFLSGTATTAAATTAAATTAAATTNSTNGTNGSNATTTPQVAASGSPRPNSSVGAVLVLLGLACLVHQ